MQSVWFGTGVRFSKVPRRFRTRKTVSFLCYRYKLFKNGFRKWKEDMQHFLGILQGLTTMNVTQRQ